MVSILHQHNWLRPTGEKRQTLEKLKKRPWRIKLSTENSFFFLFFYNILFTLSLILSLSFIQTLWNATANHFKVCLIIENENTFFSLINEHFIKINFRNLFKNYVISNNFKVQKKKIAVGTSVFPHNKMLMQYCIVKQHFSESILMLSQGSIFDHASVS